MCFVGDRRPAVLTDWNPLTYRLTMEHHQMRKQCLSDRSATHRSTSQRWLDGSTGLVEDETY